jgi:hypothetical protein
MSESGVPVPLCTYTGKADRYYPTLGLHALPGLVIELAELPTDGRWELTPNVPEPLPLPLEG